MATETDTSARFRIYYNYFCEGDAESAGLQAEIGTAERSRPDDDRAAQLHSAESLLGKLGEKRARPISRDIKRPIIGMLVEKIEANTVERCGVPGERDHDHVPLQSAERARSAGPAESASPR